MRSRVHAGFETSLSVADTVSRVRRHRWTIWDVRHAIPAAVVLFALSVVSWKAAATITVCVLLALSIPLTAQVAFPLLPVIAWLLLFYAGSGIPNTWRPRISVSLLPTLDSILYGADLGTLLAGRTHPLLDVLAWLPYGIVHFAAPILVALLIAFCGPPGSLPVYAQTFGYMNLLGVLVQLLFPSCPPWYRTVHGSVPADYSMPGSAGGLARIDALFGADMYSSSFAASPLVFGSFPSLHSGWASVHALFVAHIFPHARLYLGAYVLWLWWAAMYLAHHYLADLVAGSCLALACFLVAELTVLPRIVPAHSRRWDYTRGDSDIPLGPVDQVN